MTSSFQPAPDRSFRTYRGVSIKRSDYWSQGSAGTAKDTSLEFGRFEFKYVLSGRERALVEQAVREFMIFDPFCASLPNHCYMVNSLYFDDPNFSDYYEKIDGVLNRRKFRLRTYVSVEGGGNAPVFLEEKGRKNSFSYKLRCLIDEEAHAEVAARNWRSLMGRLGSDREVPLSSFVIAGVRRGLAPMLRVIYRRRPYVARHGYRFRLTFDDLIEAHWSTSLRGPANLVRPVLPGKTVLEVKFEDTVPVWFTRLVGVCGLNKLSISKYCKAAEALGLVENLE